MATEAVDTSEFAQWLQARKDEARLEMLGALLIQSPTQRHVKKRRNVEDRQRPFAEPVPQDVQCFCWRQGTVRFRSAEPMKDWATSLTTVEFCWICLFLSYPKCCHARAMPCYAAMPCY